MRLLTALFALTALALAPLAAQVPSSLNYQGRVSVDGVNFDGPGQFKFALLSATEAEWSNDGTATLESPPTDAVTLPVTKGLYSVLLGDTSLAGMIALPPSVFAKPDLRLRVWFDDGVHGFQLLTPDQPLAAAGYAMMSASVADGAVTGPKLAPGAVGAAQLADGAVTSAALAPGAVAPALATGASSVAATANGSYLATGNAPVNFTLPTSAQPGDVVQITGGGSGGWSVSNPGWSPREAARAWTALAASADGAKILATELDGRLYHSSDAGATWTPRESARAWRAAASSADGTRLIATTYRAPDGAVYLSSDSGVTWTSRTFNDDVWLRAVASSPDGQRLLVAADGFNIGGYLYVSPDGGRTWQQRLTDVARRWTAVASGLDGQRLVAVDRGLNSSVGGKIYVSIDGGANWSARDSDRDWNSVSSSLDGQKLLASVTNGFLYVSLNGGNTWQQRASSGAWRTVLVVPDGSAMYAAAQNGDISVSTDDGATWSPSPGGDAPTNSSALASSNQGNRVFAAGNIDRIYAKGTVLSGGQGGGATLLYAGNGLWQSVGAAQLAAGTVRAEQVAAGAITAPALATAAVTTASLADGAVGSTQLAAGAVGTTQLANAAVGTPQLAANAVTSAKLANGAVGSAQLADGAVITAKLADGGVTSAKLADGGVTSAKLASSAVGTLQLADNSVLSAKLGPGSVQRNKLADAAVGTNELGDLTVTSAKLALGAVGSTQLASDLTLGGTVSASGSLVLDAAGANTGATLAPGLFFGSSSSGEGLASKRNPGTGQWGLSFYTNSIQRVFIANGGNVGIGTANPTLARLQVSGQVTSSLAYGYLNGSGSTGTATNSVPISIHASDRIAATEFNAYSDARLKTVAGVSDAGADLRTLRQIEITDYTFKDRLARGDKPQKKVIAQQIETVFPQAVSRHTDVVPDIFRAAELRADGWIELATDLRVGERVKLVTAAEQAVHAVLEVRPGAFRTALREAGRVFVYGREVEDFRTVDYEAVSMLHVSATQELARQLERSQAEQARQARLLESTAAELDALRRVVTELAPELRRVARSKSAAAAPARKTNALVKR